MSYQLKRCRLIAESTDLVRDLAVIIDSYTEESIWIVSCIQEEECCSVRCSSEEMAKRYVHIQKIKWIEQLRAFDVLLCPPELKNAFEQHPDPWSSVQLKQESMLDHNLIATIYARYINDSWVIVQIKDFVDEEVLEFEKKKIKSTTS